MSYISFTNREIILHDAANQPRSLVELGIPATNKSDVSSEGLFNDILDTLQKLFNRTLAGAINSVIFLRIVKELLHKPKIYNVLHVGQWSPLDDFLAVTLPKFNAQNRLWYYAPTRPVGQFANVNFFFAEVSGGGYFVPVDKFDAVIFSEQRFPPIELLLAAKDYGKVFFVAPRASLPDFCTTSAQIFDLEQNISVVELELPPPIKQEVRRRSPQGQLDDKKAQIKQTFSKVRDVAKKINELSSQEKNSCLDEYIAEVTRAEKLLNEIFTEVHSDTIKLNFNVFKEFLIDFRLYDDWQLKSRAAEDLNRQIGVLEQDLDTL